MSLPRLLERAARPTLLLADSAVSHDFLPELPDGVSTHVFGEPADAGAEDARWACVVVTVADRSALRRAVETPPRLGRTRAVVGFLVEASAPLVPDVRPEWPEPVELDAHLTADGGAVTRLRFPTAVPVHEVLGRLGVDAGSPGTATRGGLVVGGDDGPDAQVPPDVLRSGAPSGQASPVTGRRAVLVEGGPVVVDEGVFNPTGFRRDAAGPVVDLADLIDRAGLVTESAVVRSRPARAVRVSPASSAYDIAALALAGVPLVASPECALPDGVGAELGALVTSVGDAAVLRDPLRREEHSVRLRRAAAAAHSTMAERLRLAQAAGVRVSGLPTVSVVLATRRPEQLDFALTQVAKQRGVSLELVLAPHGFDVDPAVLRARLCDRPVVVRPAPADALFGAVLAAAGEAASGDVVLKMDDDDWYGPDVVSDLLWARRTSGAELVGMPAEMVYLEQLGITVRRRTAVERTARVVAGGTMMIDRQHLRALGGFRPVTRYVDAQLIAAVRQAGGRVHRTQGLGYVLRRGAGGHTWATDPGYFLTRRAVAQQWRGFRPSALLSFDESERPVRPPGDRVLSTGPGSTGPGPTRGAVAS